MKTVIVGDPGVEWTNNPRALTNAEKEQIKQLTYVGGVKLHRELTKPTLKAASQAVNAIRTGKL